MQTSSTCEAGPSKLTVPHIVTPLSSLIAPLRFSIVAHSINSSNQNDLPTAQSVYKGGFPKRRNVPFLRRLRLKTILSLTPKPIDALDDEVSSWAKSSGVNLVHVKCEKPKEDGGGLSKEAAAKALMHLLDARQLPLYVHCLDGQSVSTLLIGVLRKVQAWSARAYMEEIKRSLGNNEEIVEYQRSFIEKFGKSDGIRLPSRRFLPEWTWSIPSPLSRLKDPYDVILPSREKGIAISGSNTPTNSHLGNYQKGETNDGFFAASSLDTPPLALQFTAGTLPVQHPLLKLRFDHDADLPLPLITHPSTPTHSRDGNTFMSPAPSRPSSRSGRHTTHGSTFHSHMQGSDLRSTSRPASNQASPLMSTLNLAPSPTIPRSPSHSAPTSHHSNSIYEEYRSNEYASVKDHSRVPALHHRLLHHDSTTPTKPSHLSNTSTPRASISSPPTTSQAGQMTALYGLGLRDGHQDQAGSRTAAPSNEKQQSCNDLMSDDATGSGSESEKVVKDQWNQTPIHRLQKDYFSDHEGRQVNGCDTTSESRVFHGGLSDDDRDEDKESGDGKFGAVEFGARADHKDLRGTERRLERSGMPIDTEAEANQKVEGTEGVDEDEEVEEEEEEESEEEEDGEEEDDGLALEALDLDGY